MNFHPLFFVRGSTVFLILALLCLAASSLEAREGMVSQPYALSDGRSLVLSTHETWDGRSEQVAVDVTLSGTSAPPQRVHRQLLFETSFDLASTSASGVYPAVITVLEQGGSMAVLWKAIPTGTTTENGYYLLLNHAGSAYQAANTLEMSDLLPASRSSSPQQPLELALNGLRQVHITHHDGFKVDMRIAQDNSVTINGKPTAPGNAPIKQLYYRNFLNALSPATAQSYDVPLQNAKPVIWWMNPDLKPPFSFQDYLKMDGLISWITPPAIDPATIPPELIQKPADQRLPGTERKSPNAHPTGGVTRRAAVPLQNGGTTAKEPGSGALFSWAIWIFGAASVLLLLNYLIKGLGKE